MRLWRGISRQWWSSLAKARNSEIWSTEILRPADLELWEVRSSDVSQQKPLFHVGLSVNRIATYSTFDDYHFPIQMVFFGGKSHRKSSIFRHTVVVTQPRHAVVTRPHHCWRTNMVLVPGLWQARDCCHILNNIKGWDGLILDEGDNC